MVGGGGSRDASTVGEKFRTYLALESVWWVGMYAICFRYKPTMAIMRTDAGSAVVQRAGRWLQGVWPSRYESIAAASTKVYTSPNGRTFGEWLLINKVLSPVSFPVKVAVANRIVNQRHAAYVDSTAPSPPVGRDEAESDLVPIRTEVQERLGKSLSRAVPPMAGSVVGSVVGGNTEMR